MQSTERNSDQLLPQGIIRLERKFQLAYAARSFRVYIDQEKVGRIANGVKKDYEVSPGIHTIQIRIDFYRSELFQIDVKPNQKINLRCGQNIFNIFNLRKYLVIERDIETVKYTITVTFLEVIYFFFSLLIILSSIYVVFFTQKHVMTSNAMSPVIKLGERIIVDKLFHFPIKHEDIVVIKHKSVIVKLSEKEKLKLSKIYKQNQLSNMSKEYTVIRIIGFPGEKIEIKKNTIYINGEPFRREYLSQDLKWRLSLTNVPTNSYFVLEDNPTQTNYNSRKIIKQEDIIGKVIMIYNPCCRMVERK